MQPADDGAGTAHLLHPQRHDDGDDGGHAFGDGGHGDGDGGHEIFQQRAFLEKDAEQEDERRHGDDEGGDDAPEHRQRPFERGLRRGRFGEHAGDLADLGMLPRLHDERLRLPANDEGRRVQHTGAVCHRRPFRARGRRLGRPFRLAREGRFVAAQLLALQDAAVGGDDVAFFQKDDVAGDQRRAFEQHVFAAAHRLGAAYGEAAQLFDGVVGAVLLDETDKGIQEDDEEQDARVRKVGGVSRDIGDDGGNGRGTDEKDGHEVFELRQKQAQRPALLFVLQTVDAEALAPLFRLLLRNAERRTLQRCQRLFCRK